MRAGRTEADGAGADETNGHGDEEGARRAREAVARALERLEAPEHEPRHWRRRASSMPQQRRWRARLPSSSQCSSATAACASPALSSILEHPPPPCIRRSMARARAHQSSSLSARTGTSSSSPRPGNVRVLRAGRRPTHRHIISCAGHVYLCARPVLADALVARHRLHLSPDTEVRAAPSSPPSSSRRSPGLSAQGQRDRDLQRPPAGRAPRHRDIRGQPGLVHPTSDGRDGGQSADSEAPLLPAPAPFMRPDRRLRRFT
jgi:hypothetical protein